MKDIAYNVLSFTHEPGVIISTQKNARDEVS